MEIKEKLYKEEVSENKATETHYKMHEIKPIYCSLPSLQGDMAMAFIEEN
jgi:hypothetical protein